MDIFKYVNKYFSVLLSVKLQQPLHFVLLFTTVLSFLIFLYSSDPVFDDSRKYYEFIAYLVSGCWATLIFVLGLLSPEAEPLKTLGSGYRSLLNKIVLLVSVNSIFALLLVLVSYQNLAYRQVYIEHSQVKSITMEVIALEHKKIVTLPANKGIKLRLKTGEIELYYYHSDDNEQLFPGGKIFLVKPIWQSMPPVTLDPI
ncbi:membrane hypothetical protein [Vibrio coralliirubri]|uniref:hypothetical protein n=1 Tax=Vibrio coralliirubri TaxID=1516159 RepID=UPI00063A47D6|nr:hypothetical protein [Vibrio coralliirubri]CDT84167.1 membrane hypothetical protein [Vibrio coralliirubri]